MELITIGSSSAGNGYILKAEDEYLFIEAGRPLKEYLPHIKFDLAKVAGCVVSHSHSDHAKYAKDFSDRGVVMLMPEDAYDVSKIKLDTWDAGKRKKVVKPKTGFKLGNFKVIALPVVHDVPCFAYIIDHPEMGRLFFLTDTMMLEYKLPRINHYLLECNYCDELLMQNVEGGVVPLGLKERITKSHMELKTTKGVLAANDLSETQEIVLIHLSNDNSDERRFTEEISRLTGVPTYAAKKNFKLYLNQF